MPWARLDDGYFTHRKVASLSKDAKLLDLAGIAFCARELRDGVLTRTDIRMVAAQIDIDDVRAAVNELVAAGRWAAANDTYTIHDYLVYNPSREEVLRERSMRETRKQLYGDPFLTQRVRARDGDLCRYCRLQVRWNDRKGTGGGTYDHVEPSGGNSDANIVVACRGCNSRKGRRTPDQAGMPLLAPPQPQNGATHDLPEIYPESAGNLPEIEPGPSGKSMHPDPDPDPDPDPVPSPVKSPKERVSSVTAPRDTLDEAFKRKLEDEFWEQFGSRETVRAHIGAALAHTARTKYTDDRAYVIRWLRDDADRLKAPPGRNGRPEQKRRPVDHSGCPAGCTKEHRP